MIKIDLRLIILPQSSRPLNLHRFFFFFLSICNFCHLDWIYYSLRSFKICLYVFISRIWKRKFRDLIVNNFYKKWYKYLKEKNKLSYTIQESAEFKKGQIHFSRNMKFLFPQALQMVTRILNVKHISLCNNGEHMINILFLFYRVDILTRLQKMHHDYEQYKITNFLNLRTIKFEIQIISSIRFQYIICF